MKTAILTLVVVAIALQAPAQGSDYQANLKQTRERLEELEIQRDDYRKVTPQDQRPKLSPAQEVERYRLLGQLFSDDPIWALRQQVQADIEALVDRFKPEIPAANRAVLEDLKDFLALISAFEGRPTTRAEADTLAAALRQFVVRRDVSGAQAWAKGQHIL